MSDLATAAIYGGNTLLSGLGGLFGDTGDQERQRRLFDATLRQLFDPNYLPNEIAAIPDVRQRQKAIDSFRNNPLLQSFRQGLDLQSGLFDQIMPALEGISFDRPNTQFTGPEFFNPTGNVGTVTPPPPPPPDEGIDRIFNDDGTLDETVVDVSDGLEIQPEPIETIDTPPPPPPPPPPDEEVQTVGGVPVGEPIDNTSGINVASGVNQTTAAPSGFENIFNDGALGNGPVAQGQGGFDPNTGADTNIAPNGRPWGYGGKVDPNDNPDPRGIARQEQLKADFANQSRNVASGVNQTTTAPADDGNILVTDPKPIPDPDNTDPLPGDPRNDGTIPPPGSGQPGSRPLNEGIATPTQTAIDPAVFDPGNSLFNQQIQDVAAGGLSGVQDFQGLFDDLGSRAINLINSQSAGRGAFGGNANQDNIVEGLGRLGIDIADLERRNRSGAIQDALGTSGNLFSQGLNTFGANLGAQNQAFTQGLDTFNTNTDLFFRNLAAQQQQEDRDFAFQTAPLEAAFRLFQGGNNPLTISPKA